MVRSLVAKFAQDTELRNKERELNSAFLQRSLTISMDKGSRQVREKFLVADKRPRLLARPR